MLDTLFKPKWQHKNPDKRIKALQRLNKSVSDDQHIIQELLQNDPDINVRLLAAGLCEDIHLLQQLSDKAPQTLQQACQEQLCGLLIAPPKHLSDEQVLDFIAHRASNDVLQHLVAFSSDNRLASEALLHIQDQAALAHLAQHSKSTQYRQTSAQLLQDPQLINQVLNQSKGKDKKVTQLLKEKLKQIKNDNRQEQAQQNTIEEIIAKLKQLSQAGQQAQLAARLGLLKQQWQALDTNSEQQQSFEQQYRQCQAIITRQAQQDEQQQAAAAKEQEIFSQQHTLIGEYQLLRAQLLSEALLSTEALCQLEQRIKTLQSDWQTLQQENTAKPQDRLQYEQIDRDVVQLLPAWQTLLQKEQQLPESADTEDLVEKDFGQIKQQLQRFQKLAHSINWPENLTAPKPLQNLYACIEQQQARFGQLKQQQQQIQHTLKQQIQQIEKTIADGQLEKAKSLMAKARQNLSGLDHEHAKALKQSLHQTQLSLNELKDWHQYATNPKREALCEKMEQLIETQLPAQAKRQAIKELQQSWRELGNDQHSKALWERFKKASDTAFEPCQAAFEKEKAVRLHNGKQREEICLQLETYLEQLDWQQADFQIIEQIYRQAANEWKRFAPVERSVHKALQERFNQPMQTMKQALHQHKSDNIDAKKALVEKAQALLQEPDSQAAIQQIKQLQQQWKSIGLSFQKQNQQLWGEFRQACDALFERRNQEQETAKGERDNNLKQAQNICQQIRQLGEADDNALQQNRKQVQQLAQEFHQLGALPKQDYQASKSAFQAAMDYFQQRFDGIALRQQQQALNLLLQSCEQLDAIEAATSTDEKQALVSQFMIPPELPDNWQDSLNKRQQAALNTGEQVSQQQAFEQLCIQLEVLTEQPTPEAYQQQRMQYQMQQLSQSFGKQSQVDTTTEIAKLVQQWSQLNSSNCPDYASLKQRFFDLVKSRQA